MPRYPAGTLGVAGHQARHVAFSLTGRDVVVALIVIAAVIVLLAAPLLGGALFDLFCAGAEKAAPGTFLFGLGVLLAGLIAGLRVLDLAGGCVLGACVLGVIVSNYLLRRHRRLVR